MSRAPSRRGRRIAATLVLLFIVLPVVEIYLLVQLGQEIGAGWTLLIVLAGCAVGFWLVRHQGHRAWQALRQQIETGEMPARELTDRALVLVGGLFLIMPGLISDVLALALILPPSRALFRRLLMPYAAGQVVTRPRPGPTVVRGEVIDDEPEEG